jgi:hypothetical protein
MKEMRKQMRGQRSRTEKTRVNLHVLHAMRTSDCHAPHATRAVELFSRVFPRGCLTATKTKSAFGGGGAAGTRTVWMMQNKKAQFYILTAIVLIAFSLLTVHTSIEAQNDPANFKKLYYNFVFESDAAINNALYEQKGVNQEYEVFLNSFIAYSRMKNLRTEIFSVLQTGDRVYFSNKMQTEVTIINLNTTLPAGTNTYFLRSNISEAVLEVKDDVFHENIYKLNLSNQGTDSKAILKLKKGSKRQIFVKE